jgi:hypothetical protein
MEWLPGTVTTEGVCEGSIYPDIVQDFSRRKEKASERGFRRPTMGNNNFCIDVTD